MLAGEVRTAVIDISIPQGHMNPEPITKRWMRGTTWRMVREIIFGIG
jgi:hypothetical protein